MDSLSIKLKVGTIEIPSHPIFGDDVKLKVSRDDTQIFSRMKVDGKVVFNGSDFDFIDSCSEDTTFTLAFYRGSTLVGSGDFIKADCDFNYDDKTCKVKLTTTDRYEKILAGYDNKYNLVKLAPVTWGVTMYRRPVLQFYMLGDTKITNYIGNTAFEEDAAEGAENKTIAQLTNTYKFSKIFSYSVVNVTVNASSYSYDNYAFLNAASGEYTAEFNSSGQITRLVQSGGAYTIAKDNEGIYRVYYNGNAISGSYTDQEGGIQYYPLRATVVETGMRIVVTVETTYYDQETGSYYTHEVIGSGSGDERTIFCRMIHNYGPSIPNESTAALANLSDDVAERNYNFLYCSTVTNTGAGNGIFASTEVQNEPTEYGVNGEGKYFVAPAVHSVDNVMIPIAWNMWIPMSWWFEGGPWIYNIINSYWKRYTLKDAYPLWSCIQRLLAEIDSSITYNPDSSKHLFFRDAYYGESFGNLECDYIPSPRERVCQLCITPVTNVKKTFYEQAAQKGDITLKQIFDMLRSVFNVYWWIDDDNELRMEHIEYFKNNGSYVIGEPSADVDITAMKDMPNNLPWTFGQNEISYDRSKCPNRYEFQWGDNSTEQFQGYAIDINSKNASGGKAEKVRVENFIADIDYITIRPDDVSDDLYVVFEAKTQASGQSPHAVPWCEIRMHDSSPVYSLLNGYLSFMFAAKYYWKYNMGGWDATCLGAKYNVADVAQYVKQTIDHPIPINKVGSIGAVKTELGVGLIDEQEVNLDTLYAKSKILMRGERDYIDQIGIERHTSSAVVLYVVRNNYYQKLCINYIRKTIYGQATIETLTLAAGASNTIFYDTRYESFAFVGATLYGDYLKFGDFTQNGGADLDYTVRNVQSGGGLVISTADSHVGKWGYIQLRCSHRTRINISANCGNTDSLGYVGEKPFYETQDAEDNALAYASGSGYVQYIADAGETVYLGYVRAIFGSNDDTVEFEIEVPEDD